MRNNITKQIFKTMQANNVLSLPRLGLLFRQGFVHNFRMLLISVVAFCGALFLLLLAIQALESDSKNIDREKFAAIFMFIVIPLSIIYTGTAFPAFRSKEKSYSYLLVPASAFEKFIFEFFNRVFLFLIVIPVLYWAVFNIEVGFAKAIMREHVFESRALTDLLAMADSSTPGRVWGLMTVLASLIVVIPFTGAASFTKYPVPKTLFIVAVVFLFNFLIAYLFIEVVGVGNYHLPADDKSVLFIEEETSAFRAATIYGLIINAGLLLAAYFKLREKEV
jgi:hypothetical protein